jgi:hypothetical protein
VALVGRASIAGAPTFTSPASALSPYAIAIDTDGVITADSGITVDGAAHATLQLDDAPGPGVPFTSLWQQDLVAFRAIRYLGWVKRADAVAVLDVGTP